MMQGQCGDCLSELLEMERPCVCVLFFNELMTFFFPVSVVVDYIMIL